MAIDEELEKIRKKVAKELLAVPDAIGVAKELRSGDIKAFIAKNKLAIIDFSAIWCPPCKIMDPIIKELAKEFKGIVAFGKVNTDVETMAAYQFQIRFVPTFYFFEDGKAIAKFSGAKKKKDFVEYMKKKFETLKEKIDRE